MILFWLPIGILPFMIVGWLLIRLLEGERSVFLQPERCAFSFLFGGTLTMYITFLAHEWFGIPLTLWGYFVVQVIVIGVLMILYFIFQSGSFFSASISLPSSRALLLWQKILLSILGVWSALQIAAGSMMLLFAPSYFYDVLKNWNMRGKMFFYTQKIMIERPFDTHVDLSSYPPTVSLIKSWLATLAGSWSEPLVNSIHLLWYACIIILLYSFLRRCCSLFWSLLGTYILISLPLYLLQGTSAFADVFVSVHIFAAVTLVYRFSTEQDSSRCHALIRLSTLAIALLVFTKNEGLVLYLPFVLLFFAVSVWRSYVTKLVDVRRVVVSILSVVIAVGAVAIPWVLYKVQHGMVFGNAKPISAVQIDFHTLAFKTILIMNFLEANWIFLIPLFIGLIIIRWRRVLHSPLLFLIGITCMLFVVQVSLYLFTSLAVEAEMQTGYARGVVHLIPLIVACCVLMITQISSVSVKEVY